MHRPAAAKSQKPRGPETKQQQQKIHTRKNPEKKSQKENSNREADQGLREIKNKERESSSRGFVNPCCHPRRISISNPDFYEATGVYASLLGRATARTDGVLFALAPRVAPSNQKASGGHGNGEHPSPSGTSAGGLPTDKCAVHASANLEKQNTLSLFARAPGTWRLLLP